jgi:hypothetical protein
VIEAINRVVKEDKEREREKKEKGGKGQKYMTRRGLKYADIGG